MIFVGVKRCFVSCLWHPSRLSLKLNPMTETETLLTWAIFTRLPLKHLTHTIWVTGSHNSNRYGLPFWETTSVCELPACLPARPDLSCHTHQHQQPSALKSLCVFVFLIYLHLYIYLFLLPPSLTADPSSKMNMRCGTSCQRKLNPLCGTKINKLLQKEKQSRHVPLITME